MGATVSTAKRPIKTAKQRAFVKEYIRTGNAVKAALSTYNTDKYSVAAGIASDNMAKLDIASIFDKAGLSDDAIAKTLREALSATNRFKQPDWLPRLKASEMALKVKGHFKERIEHSGAVGVYPILGGASKQAEKIEEGEVVQEGRGEGVGG